MNKKFIIQLFKYGTVGVLNTLVTAVVIWLMMHRVFQVKGDAEASSLVIAVSNITGCLLGFINSFVCNRLWTFRSQNNWMSDFMRFVGAFVICYIPQLLLVMLLNRYVPIPALYYREYTLTSADSCQLIGMVFYTLLNFLCNKYYTFKMRDTISGEMQPSNSYPNS